MRDDILVKHGERMYRVDPVSPVTAYAVEERPLSNGRKAIRWLIFVRGYGTAKALDPVEIEAPADFVIPFGERFVLTHENGEPSRADIARAERGF